MAARGPVTLTLPPFRGAVRRLVIAQAAVFFGLELLNFVSRQSGAAIRALLLLEPAAVVGHLWVWQLGTYGFINLGILNTVFALLTLWFTGTMLEESRGPRWFLELFYLATIGGALVATLLACLPLFSGGRLTFLGVSPISAAAGLSAPLFGVLVAFAVLFGDVEFLLFFLLRIKAKYMVILGALIYLATLLKERDSFSALLTLCCGACGYAYVKLVGRSGVTAIASERYFGMRNDWFRWKRRRTARKFQVYMSKQDRVVKFDEEGRYIEPEEERRDPNDRKWMN